MTKFPQDFLDFWKAYKAPKNASRIEAWSAWNKTAKDRPSVELLIACCEAYGRFLDAEFKRTGREHPKLHGATFLRQMRWEGFLEDAERILAAKKPTEGRRSEAQVSWLGMPKDKISAALADMGENMAMMFQKWFEPASFVRSEPPKIIFPTEFHRDFVQNRFGKVLESVWPGVRLEVEKKTRQE